MSNPVTEYAGFVHEVVDDFVEQSGSKKAAISLAADYLGISVARAFGWSYNRITEIAPAEINNFERNRVAFLERRVRSLEARSKCARDKLAALKQKMRDADHEGRTEAAPDGGEGSFADHPGPSRDGGDQPEHSRLAERAGTKAPILRARA
jgi:hypothetical protein